MSSGIRGRRGRRGGGRLTEGRCWGDCRRVLGFLSSNNCNQVKVPDNNQRFKEGKFLIEMAYTVKQNRSVVSSLPFQKHQIKVVFRCGPTNCIYYFSFEKIKSFSSKLLVVFLMRRCTQRFTLYHSPVRAIIPSVVGLRY